MLDFLATYNLLGGAIALLEPSGLFHPYVAMTVHALIWHTMLLFLGFYLIFSGRACKRLKDAPWNLALFYAFALVAVIINLLLKAKSHNQVNMFFLGFGGPGLPVYQSIFESCGWAISALVYTISLSFAAFLVFLLANLRGRKSKA